MWHGSIVLSGLLTLLLFHSGCGDKVSTTSEVENNEVAVDTLPADFVIFFNQFHEDSTYQMNHINFPLEGLPPYGGENDTILLKERYFWPKATWHKHNRFTDPGGDFEHWYVVINERIIEHWIKMKGTNLHMKRRFAKLDDGWYLIYYQGLRPTEPEFN